MRITAAIVLAAAAAGGASLPRVQAGSVGLRVSPGGALIQGIEPGQKAELAVPITVMNDDAEPKLISFAAVAPGREKMKVPPGYSDIPDPSWVSFSANEVEAPAKGHVTVKVILAIPPDEQYHNQHWSVAIAVRTKAVAGQMLTLGLYPRFEIETSPARLRRGTLRRPRPPAGALAITPSIEAFDDVAPGGPPRLARLTFWNNTAKPWRGTLSILAGVEAAKEARLDRSGGWEWLPDPSWVKLPAEPIEARANASAELPLEVAVPAARHHHGCSWEAIVLLKGEDGQAAFARLRVKTMPAER